MSGRLISRILLATCFVLFTIFSLTSGAFARSSLNSPLLSGKNIPSWSQWHIVPGSNAGPQNELTAILALSGKDVWAVGDYNGTTLTEHWNGTSWSIVASPDVSNSFNFLLGVAAVASNNLWAVGYYHNDSTPNRTLILHWNGERWRIVPSPNASPDWNVLYAVTTAPNGTATAVGYYYDTDITTKTLIEASR